jgi:hypothetical protein
MDWLRDHFEPEELGPEDLAAQRVHAALIADTKLGSIFGARLYCRDFPPLIQPGQSHDLTVAPFAGTETQRPGFLDTDITIYLTVRFLWPRDMPARPGKAGIATLGRYLTRILNRPEHRLLPVPVGEPAVLIPLASEGARPGPVNPRPVAVPGSDEAAVAVILSYDYKIPLDRETQRPKNIVDAGG